MKIIVKNKKAFFNYEILDKYEAGLVLTGAEIKSIRTGKAAIQESYITFNKNEVFIINMNISNYHFTSSYQVDPLRKRKLLLNRQEIIRIFNEVKTKNFIVIPLSLYLNKNGIAKIEIALAKPKKLYDKRENIKERQLKREIKNIL